jgi:hypothetical protein
MFLKEILKKLRGKLLIKVLEKQDELAIKTDSLINVTASQLSELRHSVKTSADIQTELWASLERMSAKAASKQEAVEKTLGVVAKNQADLKIAMEKATASAVIRQDVVGLKMRIDTLRADVEKMLVAIEALKVKDEQPTPTLLKAEKGL